VRFDLSVETSALFSRRSVLRVLADSFRYFVQDLPAFLLIAAIALVPVIANFAIEQALKHASAGVGFASVLLTLPIFSAAQGVIDAIVVIRLVRPVSETTPDSVWRTVRLGLSFAFKVFVAVFRGMLIATLLSFSILGSPWGIARLVRWAFVTQSIVLSGADEDSALDASAEVVKGQWWLAVGQLALVMLVFGVIAIPFLVVSFSGHTSLWITLAAHVLRAATTPLFAIARTLIYFDLKSRKAETGAVTP
jgi:hypothetical protein